MKKFVLFLITCSMLFGLTGCGNSDKPTPSADPKPADKVEVVIWHTYTEHQTEALQKIADDFNASQDYATVVIQPQAYQDFDAKVMQAVRNGTGPDIIFNYAATAYNYLEDGLVVELGKYVNDPEIGIPGFKESFISEAVYNEAVQFPNGEMYIIPTVTTGAILFYNKTLYDELDLKAPETWAELAENCKTIYDAKGIAGFGFDSLQDGMQTLIMQAGSGYVDLENNAILYNNEIAVERLDWFADQVKAGYFKLKPDDYYSTEFGSEIIASYIGSVAGYSYVEAAVDGKFEFATAPLPQEGGTTWAPAWNRGGIVFTSDEATERAAYQFIKYFVSPEVSAQWCVDFAAIPPTQEAHDSAVFQAFMETNPGLKTLAEGLDGVGYLPAFKGSVEARNELAKAIEEIATGLKTAEQALADAEAVVNAAMNE